MKTTFQTTIVVLILLLGHDLSLAQTYNDGPIELKVKVREFNVTLQTPADGFLAVGGIPGSQFLPDEYTFNIGAQDNPNISGLGWQQSPCLQDNFDPPGLTNDFNLLLFNYVYSSSIVPKYFSLRLDAWQDNCGSDSGPTFSCGGSRCVFETTCTDFVCGTLAGVGDNNHCDSPLFKDTLDYRAAGPPCQWNSHGTVVGNCPSNNIYEPVIESYWSYTMGSSCGNAIDLGTLPAGGILSHYNSNECYTNDFAASPGNDVFYEFSVNSNLVADINLCSQRTDPGFDTYLYLLSTNCTAITSSDDQCGIQSGICITINPGHYYLVVDGKTAADMGAFELTISDSTSGFTGICLDTGVVEQGVFSHRIFDFATGNYLNPCILPPGAQLNVGDTVVYSYVNKCCTQLTCFESLNCKKQNITISPGWNLISSYINPDAPDMANVFTTISSDILLVKNGAGQSYIPSFAINNIGNWQVEEGYKVKSSASTTLTMGCDQVDPTTTPINLNAGWNIIAYLRTTPMDATIALASISSNILLVKDGTGSSYIPSFGINGIGNMEPGQGYKVKMSTAEVLYYPAN